MSDAAELIETRLAAETFQVRVRALIWEAPGVLSLELVAADGSALPAFAPGAHIDLTLPDGTLRQYSLCGDPANTSHYRIGIRAVTGVETALIGKVFDDDGRSSSNRLFRAMNWAIPLTGAGQSSVGRRGASGRGGDGGQRDRPLVADPVSRGCGQLSRRGDGADGGTRSPPRGAGHPHAPPAGRGRSHPGLGRRLASSLRHQQTRGFAFRLCFVA